MLRMVPRTLHHPIRALAAAPASSALAILILTLAIAAATVTFSVVDSIVLRSLGFGDEERLVAVYGQRLRGRDQVAAVEYLAWADRAGAFENVAAHRGFFESLPVGAATERIHGARTTASLFPVLGTTALLGRVFGPEHEVSGRDNVAVIGYGLWARIFGADPTVIGRTLPFRDGPVEIIGVMPPGFTYPVTMGNDRPVEVWTPYVIPPEERSLAEGRSSYLQIVGRLRPGASLEQAQAEVEAGVAALAADFPRPYRDWRPIVRPLHEYVVGDVRGWMKLVLWAVILLMVVACVNVANLLLTRSANRARELAVRASLGATRGGLLTASLLESLILFSMAAALGIFVASWGIDVVKSALPGRLARASAITLDLRVLGSAITAALVSAVVFGAVPAWQASKVDVLALLQSGGASVTLARRRWRSALLVVEVAFVAVLLVTTALFVGSFLSVTRVNLGFERSRLLVAGPSSRMGVVIDDIVRDVRALPGVAGAAIAAGSSAPLIAISFGGGWATTPLQPADGSGSAGAVSAELLHVSPDYFDVMRIDIRQGRGFTAADRADAPAVVVLDEVAARRLAGDRDPLGMRLTGRRQDFSVIGIAAAVRTRGPERDPVPQVYMPLQTRGPAPQIVIRTVSDPAGVVPSVEALLARYLPGGTRPRVLRIEDAFRRITAERRFNASVMSVFGLLALLIGAAGVYGVMASSVAQRTREIGVRVALGATASRVIRSVFADAARCLLPGLALGLASAWLVSRAFAALLFGLRPTDLAVYVLVGAVLLAVGLIAAVLPARRAARVDPLVALREL